MGNAGGGMNLALIIGGLLALMTGMSFVALGRKNRR
jgi:amino acid transporter